MSAPEPSDAERAALPDCTRDYLAHLERENAGLRVIRQDAERALENAYQRWRQYHSALVTIKEQIERDHELGFRHPIRTWALQLVNLGLRPIEPAVQAAVAASVPVGGGA